MEAFGVEIIWQVGVSLLSPSIIFNQNTFFAQHNTSYLTKEVEVAICTFFFLQSSFLRYRANKGSVGNGTESVEQIAGRHTVKPKALNLFFFNCG